MIQAWNRKSKQQLGRFYPCQSTQTQFGFKPEFLFYIKLKGSVGACENRVEKVIRSRGSGAYASLEHN